MSDKKVKARVLTRCQFGNANDVVEVTAEELKQNPGVLCGHKASIAYAEGLKKEAGPAADALEE